MRVWLITVGEPLPTDGRVRLYRTGILARLLASRGHDVVWWTSLFDHVKKKFRQQAAAQVDYEKGLSIYLLKGIGYKKNISVSRIIDHYLIMRHFRSVIYKMPKPDIILCSYPTIELAECAVQYGVAHGLPVVVDVRDLWPDIIEDALPAPIRKLGRLLMRGWYRSASYIFTNCTAITGISESYLNFGLRYGCRSVTKNDRVFPLAYPAPLADRRLASSKKDGVLRLMGVDTAKTIFIFTGTFGKTYDLGVVISGIRLLDKTLLSGLQFIFCGDGEHSVRWRGMASDIPQIIFTGWVDSDMLRSLLSVANVGIAAYAAGAPQSIPNKIIEYMSFGLPIISGLAGETEALLKNDHLGVTYNPTNPADFASCISKLIDEGERKTLSANCKRVFTQRYRADVVYEEYISHLLSFL